MTVRDRESVISHTSSNSGIAGFVHVKLSGYGLIAELIGLGWKPV